MGQTGGFAASSWLVRQVASKASATEIMTRLRLAYESHQ